jgi:tetratricopeptide (TPR) repeat protein
VILLYGLVVVGVHVWAYAAGGPPELWGVHHYAFFPSTWLWGGLAAAVVVFLLAWLLKGHGVRVPALVPTLVVVVGGGLLFWLGRQEAHFLGDGLMRIESLRQGTFIWQFEPLGITVPFLIGEVLRGMDPEVIFAGLSVASGILYLLLALWLARTVTSQPAERVLVFGLLALAGTTRLFYGYVETYPLLALITAAYLVLGVRFVRGKGSALAPALAGSAAFAVHTSAILLLPSLLVMLGGRRAQSRLRWLALLVPLAVLLVGHLYLASRGSSLVDLLSGYGAQILPLADGVGPQVQAPVFSLRHLSDLVQAQLLVGPFAALFVLILLLAGGGRFLGSDGRFLLAAGVPWLLFAVLYNHQLGAARQWDVFAPAALPWIMIAALLVLRVPRGVEQPRFGGALIGLVLGISVFHLLPWMGLGLDEDRSLRHFAALHAPGSPAAPFARSHAFDGLGTYYLSRGEVENAEMAYREAVTADTTHAYAAGHLGSLFLSTGRAREAAGILQWATRHAPDGDYLHFELGNALRALGNPVSAIASYQMALDLNPDFLPAYLALASVQRGARQFAAAESLLARAARRFPDDPQVVSNQAQLAHARGDTAQAIDLYRRSLDLDPEALDATFNLGNLFLQRREYEEAARCFVRIVAANPRDVEAWINLGVARQELGRSTESLQALEEALHLDPRRPEIFFNIFRNRMLAGDTTQAVLALRAYANQDSTSRRGRLARTLLRQLDPTPPPSSSP